MLHHRDFHILAAALFSFEALTLTPAAADNVSISPTNIDFGTVMVGALVGDAFTASFSLSAGSTFENITAGLSTIVPDLTVDPTAPHCSATVHSCIWDVGWQPTAAGEGPDLGEFTFNLITSAGTTSAHITFEGTSTAAVPEPSTWAMMLVGFAGLGFAAFRSSTKQRLDTA
jgi:hypothetical protein